MAIGFEFQIGWKIYKDKQQNGIGYQTTVLRSNGPGWKLTVDCADIEFVIEHVNMPGGREVLQQRVRDLVKFVKMLNKKKKSKVVTPGDLLGVGESIKRSYLTHQDPTSEYFGKYLIKDPQFVIVPNGETIMSNTQTTAGLRLSRINKLFDALTTNPELATLLLGTYASTYKAKVTKYLRGKGIGYGGQMPSDKLQGLIMMILLYINQGIRPSGTPSTSGPRYGKYLMFIMARTSFARLYRNLPSRERTYFTAHPDEWISFICKDIMSQVLGNTDGVDPNGYLIEWLMHGKDQIPLTRKKWLKGMTQNKEYLSETEGDLYVGFASRGELMDDVESSVGKTRKAGIFEFRGEQKRIPFTEWEDFAMTCYDVIEAVNQGEKDGVINLKKLDNVVV